MNPPTTDGAFGAGPSPGSEGDRSPEQVRWQREADLLADGREFLERWCRSTRFAHLYPDGPNFAILLESFQSFDRLRTVGRAPSGRWRQRRLLLRTLHRAAKRDAFNRDQRIRWGYPLPMPMPVARTPIIERALARVDADVRATVDDRLRARGHAVIHPKASVISASARVDRGLQQFREALTLEALARPTQLVQLPAALWPLLASAAPLRRRHPIATLVLIKFPLRLAVGLMSVLLVSYIGAWMVFNDTVLGRFASGQVSGLIEGELELGSIHWDLPLIVDLVTGQPTELVFEDVSVWEAYKSYGGTRTRRTAYAKRLHATVVVHEIIPWNRLGIPRFLDIPWVLHLPTVTTTDPAWITVREYDDVDARGNAVRLLSLVDAFATVDSDPDTRGLSLAIDTATLSTTTLDIDIGGGGEGWANASQLSWANFSLQFDAPAPHAPPAVLPLSISLEAFASVGALRVGALTIPYEDLAIGRLVTGAAGVQRGALGFSATVDAASSPLSVAGELSAVFAGGAVLPPMAVELTVRTPDAEGLLAQVSDEFGLPPGAVTAPAAIVRARVWGPVADPQYRLRAEGLTIDALGESAWGADDVVIDVRVASGPVPARWADRFPPEATRTTIRVAEFSGAALDGTFKLAPGHPQRAEAPSAGADTDATQTASEAMVVVPADPTEPWLIAADLAVEHVDPGRFFVADDAMSARLTGNLRGGLRVHTLALAGSDAGVSADLELVEVSLSRDRGPRDDGLPRQLKAQGRIVYDPSAGVDLQDVEIATTGAHVSARGGLDPQLEGFEDLRVAVVVDDGRAFSRAFGLDAYFSGLRASMTLGGSVRAPRAPPGRLVIQNLGLFAGPPSPADADTDDTTAARSTEASIWLEHGVLRVHTDEARLLGGRGSVDLWVHLFEGGTLAADPKIKGKARLSRVRPERATSGQISGIVDLDITLDDGDGHPARLGDLKVAGLLAGAELRIAGTSYRNARMLFSLTRDALEIERLVLPVHRGVSPFHGPRVTIAVGEVVATGRVGLQHDPTLDLEVSARGVGLDVVARLLGVDSSVGGRIDEGTQLAVGGTLARPRIDGTVNLVGLSAAGVVLGGGSLQVSSSDVAGADGLAAHRLLEVKGVLSAADLGDGPLEWRVDALAAFGAAGPQGAPIDAELDLGLDRLSLRALLGDPQDLGLPSTVRGELTGLSALVTACGGARPMLSQCRDKGGAAPLQIDVGVESMQLGQAQGRQPLSCDESTTLCSQTRLDATLDWPVFALDRPWRLATGGEHPAVLAVSGSFDLASAPGEPVRVAGQCIPPPLSSPMVAAVPDDTRPHAQISGRVDLASLAPFFRSYGVSTASGRIDVDLSVSGQLSAPHVTGRATLGSTATGVIPLRISLRGSELPLSLPDLDLRVQSQWLTAAGRVEMMGETLTFGSVRGENTGVGLSGGCGGAWSVAAQGTLSTKLLGALLDPDVITRGQVTLDHMVVTGPGPGAEAVDRVEGTVRLRRQSLTLEVSESVPAVEITAGRVDFARCRGSECGPSVTPGSFALWLGGKSAAGPTRRARSGAWVVPKEALQARVGARGRASAWGVAHVSPDGARAEATGVQIVLADVPYRDFDGRGRSVYEMEVSSEDLLLQGGDPLVLSGSVVADRARYVKDAVQGVELLALTDEIEVPEAPPPPIVSALQFDLRAQTDSPLRVENNIAHRVEASVALTVRGTYEVPELAGRFDIEAGGTVDIPFLTGTYEIQHGRVTLERKIEDAAVDILALRNEPIYIDNEPRQIQLQLGGTVSAITWDCIADGDASGAVETTRGCLDYLVLGAGDVQVDQSDVQRQGGGGLANARKSLQVVGHVTEFDFGERIGEAVPRYESFVPDVRLRLGQIGPELDVATPPEWFDFGWAQARFGWDYARGYPGFLLLQSRKLSFQLEILDPITLEFSRDSRSYLNERIIFDPLRQRTIELRFDLSLPSIR